MLFYWYGTEVMLDLNNQFVWEVEVAAQGDHSTPVDTEGIKRFLRDVAGQILHQYLIVPPPYLGGPIEPPNYELVLGAFCAYGPWQLNVERKRLLGSNHYRLNSIRVYEDIGHGGRRIVVHLPSGRRYGHLHPPKGMPPSAAKEALRVLTNCFVGMEMLEVHQATAEGASERSIEIIDRPFQQSKRKAEPLVRVMQHLNTLMRSREKKLSLIARFWRASDESQRPLTYEEVTAVYRAHWSEHHGNDRMEFDNFIRDTLTTQTSLAGMVIESGPDQFCLGEFGEILLDEFLEEIQTREQEERRRAIKSTTQEVDRLTRRETNLAEDLLKTQAELALAKEKLASLSSDE